MPVTEIDSKAALVIIDLQKGIAKPPSVHPVEEVIKNAAELAHVFREKKLPVVLVNVAGQPKGRTDVKRTVAAFTPKSTSLIPELDQQPGDHLVTKYSRSAFTATDLEEYLRNKGVTQIVLAGMVTSIGVETTARQAYELGFNVTIALDAVTDRNAEAHENSVARIFPALSETGTSAEIIAHLNKR